MSKRGKVSQYIEALRAEGRVTVFKERLWYGTVEQVRVKADGMMRFIFKDGQIVEG